MVRAMIRRISALVAGQEAGDAGRCEHFGGGRSYTKAGRGCCMLIIDRRARMAGNL